MVSELRDRKNKRTYDWSSRSDSEADPEYTTRHPRRQATQNTRTNQSASASSSGNSVKRKWGHHPMRSVQAPTCRARDPDNYDNLAASWLKEMGESSKENRTILSWLIDHEKIVEFGKVIYEGQCEGAVPLTGTITRAGIYCQCCRKVITVWDFEVHARSNLKMPYRYIFLMGRKKSLLQCQMEAWQGQRYGFNEIQPQTSDDNHDDTCMICSDGGELICCEKCPSTFHPICMNMERVPEGEWFCAYCVCKNCGLASENLLTCSLCAKKFHWSCSVPNEIDLNISTSSFCSESCCEILEKLEQMLGMKNDLEEGYSWTLLKKEEVSSRDHIQCLHNKLECNSKLAVARFMMDQCFQTIIDRHTGIDILQSVIYSQGSNLSRINFTGFYTAILHKDDEIVSAATLRIHGRKMAEMPFVATDKKYREQGLLRKLLEAIEYALRHLKVENLIIPSAIEVVGMWTEKFNFSEIESDLKKGLVSLNTLMFPKAIRLQKSLLPPVDAADIAVMEVSEVLNHENMVQENRSERLHLNIDLNLDPS